MNGTCHPTADGWRRLFWSLPLAVAVSALAVSGLVALMLGNISTSVPAPVSAVAMQFIDVPADDPERAVPVAPVMPRAPVTQEPPPRAPPSEIKLFKPRRHVPTVRPQTRVSFESRPHILATPQTRPLPQAASPPTAGAGQMGARAIYAPMPEIPFALRHRAFRIEARARFHVNIDGTARVDLIEATPDPALNQALLDALSRWRFFPAIERGAPIASTLELRIPINVR